MVIWRERKVRDLKTKEDAKVLYVSFEMEIQRLRSVDIWRRGEFPEARASEKGSKKSKGFSGSGRSDEWVTRQKSEGRSSDRGHSAGPSVNVVMCPLL